MILLKDFFTLLATGEFSNISLRKDNSGNLEEGEYEKVIGHLNLGMIELHKRFKLMEDELILHVTPNIITYKLTPLQVATEINFDTEDYIERPDLFDGNLNIIKLTGAFDEDNESLALNNRFSTPYIRQIDSTTIAVSGLEEEMVIALTYQAHPSQVILDDDFDLETAEINISPTIVEALLNYIASRVYKPIGANSSAANSDKGNSYQQQYELSCQKLELFGVDIQNNDEPDKYEKNGWV